jgi:topoisomerase IV subunit A
LPYRPGGKLVLISGDGRGFMVAEDEAVAQTRAGKQVMNPADGATARFCLPVNGDLLGLVGDNRKLLVMPIAEVPEMSRGRGVILQKFRDGGVADAAVLNSADGLSWAAGSRMRSEPDLTEWKTGRGSTGRMVPTGFPKPPRFG